MVGRMMRAALTREVILATAERLFAENGVFAVSNRQVSEAAGQGNSAAVGYHFGTKADLVRAITRKHTEHIEELRLRMVAELAGSTDARSWIGCLIRPLTEHLASLDNPTWFARFGAQVTTDPGLREIMIEESMSSPSLITAVDGLNACLPDLPTEVRLARGDMARQLMVHVCAEQERAMAERPGGPGWQGTADTLIDALVGMWLAPVTH